jgi:hypothetical protein
MTRTRLIKAARRFGVRVFIHSSILAAACMGRAGTVEGTVRQPRNWAIKAGWRAGTSIILENIL